MVIALFAHKRDERTGAFKALDDSQVSKGVQCSRERVVRTAEIEDISGRRGVGTPVDWVDADGGAATDDGNLSID